MSSFLLPNHKMLVVESRPTGCVQVGCTDNDGAPEVSAEVDEQGIPSTASPEQHVFCRGHERHDPDASVEGMAHPALGVFWGTATDGLLPPSSVCQVGSVLLHLMIKTCTIKVPSKVRSSVCMQHPPMHGPRL